MLREIFEGPRDALWIAGMRRVGKTSLLKQAELLAAGARAEEGYLPLFWDLQGAVSADELHASFHESLWDAEERFQAIGLDPGRFESDDLFVTAARLRRELRGRRRRLLLLCDEAEELMTLAEESPATLRRLRRLLQSGNGLRSVLVSSPRLWQIEDHGAPTSPFLHGLAPPRTLGALESGAARRLVEQVCDPATGTPLLDPDASAVLREACDDHPLLLQILAKRAIELGDPGAALDDVAADGMVQHLFEADRAVLAPAERALLDELGRNGGTLREEAGGSVSPLARRNAAHRLAELRLVERNEDRLTLRNPLLCRWLAERPPEPPGGAPGDAGTTGLSEGSAGGIPDPRFRALARVGGGAAGDVFKAIDTLLEEIVAVKVLRPDVEGSTELAERLRREVVLQRRAIHPSILPVYHLGRAGGRDYVVMRWVDGGSLADALRAAGRLDVASSVALGARLASALAAAHAAGVLHRDVKPQNVLRERDGKPFLGDFGLAFPRGGGEGAGAGAFVGTPYYASPEQVEGGELDPRSDVYSLGAVLYECVTGRPPVEGSTAAAVLRGVSRVTPRSPAELAPEVPAPLSELLLSCLAKRPEERPRSADALGRALEELR
jgi:hypothetical protein